MSTAVLLMQQLYTHYDYKGQDAHSAERTVMSMTYLPSEENWTHKASQSEKTAAYVPTPTDRKYHTAAASTDKPHV
jgi:hypothetical protein